MRAVILAGGRGTRMQRDEPGAMLDPAQALMAGGGIKGMIPDGRGRPFLDHILSGLADAGITEACLVVPPAAEAVRAHYAAHPPARIRLAFVVQAMPRGTADAVVAAAAWTAGEPFLVLNADNLYPMVALRALVTLGHPGLVGFTAEGLVADGNIPAERVAAFALLRVDASGVLLGLEEKPADVPADQLARGLVSMNLWRFDATIVEACRTVLPSVRGELELPLAVGQAVATGAVFRVITLRAGVLDLSHRGDVAAVAAHLATRTAIP